MHLYVSHYFQILCFVSKQRFVIFEKRQECGQTGHKNVLRNLLFLNTQHFFNMQDSNFKGTTSFSEIKSIYQYYTYFFHKETTCCLLFMFIIIHFRKINCYNLFIIIFYFLLCRLVCKQLLLKFASTCIDFYILCLQDKICNRGDRQQHIAE